jgi:molybdopterin molybdotransferase
VDAVNGTVREVGGPASHLLGSLARAECLVVVPEDVTELAEGAAVEVWLLDG